MCASNVICNMAMIFDGVVGFAGRLEEATDFAWEGETSPLSGALKEGHFFAHCGCIDHGVYSHL